MKVMETVQDLIEEVKARTLYWGLCVFVVCYYLSHTSNSMWMNIPIWLITVSALRILSNKVEFHWRVQSVQRITYLSHLEKKQLSVNDPRRSTSPPPRKWKRKIGAPGVEVAAHDFINKLLQDFVVDLWYSHITPDKEVPELIHAMIMDVPGEIDGRVKELNSVDFFTRDVVEAIGNHLDLFRSNQFAIGTDVMRKLSTEERDERLKRHLLDSRELHPALISPECEYKVLQQLVNGVLVVVLRQQEAQCPLVRCIARELLTSLVVQPVMSFACPAYINILVECLFFTAKDDRTRDAGEDQPMNGVGPKNNHSAAQNYESTLGDVRPPMIIS